ncbi:COX3 oxidase, partial [Acromyrmex charruanus]
KVHEVAEAVGVSYGTTFNILHDNLGMKKLSAQWVPRSRPAHSSAVATAKLLELRYELLPHLLCGFLGSPDIAYPHINKIRFDPGHLNQTLLLIRQPRIFFGQCSEICGATFQGCHSIYVFKGIKIGIILFIISIFFYLLFFSIYGSTFFIATDFHGIHVIIETLFLIVCLIRLYNLHFSYHHFGFEAAS